jgi:hypothetical protein
MIIFLMKCMMCVYVCVCVCVCLQSMQILSSWSHTDIVEIQLKGNNVL